MRRLSRATNVRDGRERLRNTETPRRFSRTLSPRLGGDEDASSGKRPGAGGVGGHARRGDHAVVLRADGDFLPLGAGRRARDLPRGHLQERIQQPSLLGRLALRDSRSVVVGVGIGSAGAGDAGGEGGRVARARRARRRESGAGAGRTASFLTGPDMATDARHGLTPGRETNVFLSMETSQDRGRFRGTAGPPVENVNTCARERSRRFCSR